MKKILVIRGLPEFNKLEVSSSTVFNVVVEHAKVNIGTKPIVVKTQEQSKPAAIVRSTTAYTAICLLNIGETAPEHLPRVAFTYL